MPAGVKDWFAMSMWDIARTDTPKASGACNKVKSKQSSINRIANRNCIVPGNEAVRLRVSSANQDGAKTFTW
jgi:hypothetical protein